jgi:uncharacterized membrane protein YadS
MKAARDITGLIGNTNHVQSLPNLSKWAFLLTFAGVGLRTNLREMSKRGCVLLSWAHWENC